jgi:hypothetical protein
MNFRIAFDMLSTLFQTFLAFFDKSSSFFVFFRFFPQRRAVTSRRRERTAVNLPSLQTSLRVQWGRRTVNLAAKLPLLAKRGDVLSLRAVKGWGEGIAPPTEASHTNRIQREFDSNGAIPPFDHEPSAPKNKPSQTIKLPSPLHSQARW